MKNTVPVPREWLEELERLSDLVLDTQPFLYLDYNTSDYKQRAISLQLLRCGVREMRKARSFLKPKKVSKRKGS